jgi:hypothetical protein
VSGKIGYALLLLGIGASGCSGDSTDPSELLPGLYALATINGETLPFELVFIDDANLLEFTEGSVNLNEDGSFVDSATLRITETGVASSETTVVSGQWSRQGNSITFTPNDGSDPYGMTWNGSTRLTQGIQGFTLVYQR